jgi:hypothetical protein
VKVINRENRYPKPATSAESADSDYVLLLNGDTEVVAGVSSSLHIHGISSQVRGGWAFGTHLTVMHIHAVSVVYRRRDARSSWFASPIQ